jgi:hypothetical protein
LRKELYWEFKGNRIIEDSKSSASYALSECIGAQGKKIEQLNVLWKGKLCQVGIELVCRQAWEKRTL